MIPETNITAWSITAPWTVPRQIEQDRIISRALVEIFNHDILSAGLRFRGGTALNKIIFPAPSTTGLCVVLLRFVWCLFQRLTISDNTGDLTDARIVHQTLWRGQHAYGALFQSAMPLRQSLGEGAGRVSLPLNGIRDVECLRRIPLDHEDVVRAVCDQLCSRARRMQSIKCDDFAADVIALKKVLCCSHFSAVIIEVQEREMRTGLMIKSTTVSW